MDCLVMPVAMLRRRYSGSHAGSWLGYRALTDGGVSPSDDDQVTVVVGKERKEFFVDPFVLEQSPFRVLIETVRRKKNRGRSEFKREKGVIFVDVDSILFEHMLWLMHNDYSSLFKLNLKEIIDFYAQDY
ncbi:hypothetical protein Nepgr_024446 [Nepenthes gracilis]|uniref:Uncharacterized protein n=1 Tax=Nepenthes gracilis TaxID=150966 RepID=A0AAD3XYT4_NEPGR|nr:hypothetical protein Nepgr_024446 [Nepenthes gracilis]